uniref:Retrotransposon gag domain-containing protein n=1 Tax=Cannabis sativa TaxID=3483 RepID=A0A803NHL2_CANSA
MTITEYTTQFHRLVRLASGIVPTDFSKKEKYLDGFNPKIKHDLMITIDDNTTYVEMVGKALRDEGAVECIQESRGTQVVGGVTAPPTYGNDRGGSESTND